MPEKSESEDKSDSDNDSEDVKKVSKTTNRTSSRKKGSAAKGKAKKTTVETKSRATPKRTSKKSLSAYSESDDDSDGSPKVFSRKKKNVKQGRQKWSTLTKSSSKDKTGRHCKLSPPIDYFIEKYFDYNTFLL